ncbi:BMP family ABC transporter substrate-binding protein [Fundidesulfovibrio soli]|uniref:BMP family ABC transporter substrate-binding protein n=1 Tax=Fundidesulfovibrio soli TaxID=2922716 RepID=UPI001FAE9599|nr:BMP family ABC transporter substrate-binding protein [Fundidesulfovibrio soli]
MSRRFLSVLCCLAVLAVLPGTAMAAKLKVAFALVGTVNDQGWNYAHYVGIEKLKKQFGDQIEVSYTENVGAADGERVFRQYAQDGYKLIFGTTFEHMDPMLQVAKDFPDVSFEHCSGYKTAPNLGNYMARIEQGEYLVGYMAGLMGYTKVGTVATNPIPEPIRGINAFTHGLMRGLDESGTKYDPATLNTVVWLKSWRDPIGETAMSEALVQRGSTLIRQMADTPDASLAACAKGVPAIGYGADAVEFGAKCVLVSTIWNWGVYYEKAVKAKLDGTWKPQEWYAGFDQDALRLSAFNEKVPAPVREKVLAEMEKMKKGVDDSFLGPMTDQEGKVMIPAGQRATDKELYTMRWLSKGVNGKLPE